MATLDWSQCTAVESVPGRLGGAWVFRDTRVSRIERARNPGIAWSTQQCCPRVSPTFNRGYDSSQTAALFNAVVAEGRKGAQ